jgi:hypothetical protein
VHYRVSTIHESCDEIDCTDELRQLRVKLDLAGKSRPQLFELRAERLKRSGVAEPKKVFLDFTIQDATLNGDLADGQVLLGCDGNHPAYLTPAISRGSAAQPDLAK